MKQLISYLINPIPTILLLILVGFLCYRKGRERPGKWLYIAAAIYLLIVTTPFVPEVLLQRIERQYPVYHGGSATEQKELKGSLQSSAGGTPLSSTEALRSTTCQPTCHPKIYCRLKLQCAVDSAKVLGDQACLPARQGVSVGKEDLPVPYILVLGSGSNYDPELPATQQVGETALVRVTEGIRIHRLLPGSKLVLSAGKISQPVIQAEVTGAAAVALGVLPSDTLLLTTPLTTREEAEAFVSRFGKGTQLILVTSARHLPRAMYLFREAGLLPIAAPTDFKIGKDYGRSWTAYLPGSNSLKKSELVIHEYVGMLWARF